MFIVELRLCQGSGQKKFRMSLTKSSINNWDGFNIEDLEVCLQGCIQCGIVRAEGKDYFLGSRKSSEDILGLAKAASFLLILIRGCMTFSD